jgi:hypothetical protein
MASGEQCGVCNVGLPVEHSHCERCSECTCADCIVGCKGCGGRSCKLCFTTCEDCSISFCRDCTTECSDCGCNVCEECFNPKAPRACGFQCDLCGMARCPVCRSEHEDEDDGPRRCKCGACLCAGCCGSYVDVKSLARPHTELPHLQPIVAMEAEALRVQEQLWTRGSQPNALEQARYMDLVELVKYTARLAMGFDQDDEAEEGGADGLLGASTRIFVPSPHAHLCCMNCTASWECAECRTNHSCASPLFCHNRQMVPAPRAAELSGF